MTREHAENQTIIGFFNLETGRYRRYLIKDIIEVCKILRKTGYDFARVFGQAKDYVVYNNGVTQEEKEHQLKDLVSEVFDEVTNEDVVTMLEFFKEDNNVVSLVS